VYLIRRNTSVDESYEWDSADACVDSEVLEATKFGQSQTGCRRVRGDIRYDQTGGLQDQRQKGDHFFYNPTVFGEFFHFKTVACIIVSVMLVLHVFILCISAVIFVSSSHDIPIHAFPVPDAPLGPSPPVSPPVFNPPRCKYSRSLSEARFNALRLEYQEYRRAQESVCSREPCLTPGHDSDSETSSALL